MVVPNSVTTVALIRIARCTVSSLRVFVRRGSLAGRPLQLLEEALDRRPLYAHVVVSGLCKARRMHGMEQEEAEKLGRRVALPAERPYDAAHAGRQQFPLPSSEVSEVARRLQEQQLHRPQSTGGGSAGAERGEESVDAIESLSVGLERVEEHRVEQQAQRLRGARVVGGGVPWGLTRRRQADRDDGAG